MEMQKKIISWFMVLLMFSAIFLCPFSQAAGNQLIIHAPDSVTEGNSFLVTVTVNGTFIKDVTVHFLNGTYSTNVNGSVMLTHLRLFKIRHILSLQKKQDIPQM
jgi:hypothetical protein